jgi:hypothetical protein
MDIDNFNLISIRYYKTSATVSRHEMTRQKKTNLLSEVWQIVLNVKCVVYFFLRLMFEIFCVLIYIWRVSRGNDVIRSPNKSSVTLFEFELKQEMSNNFKCKSPILNFRGCCHTVLGPDTRSQTAAQTWPLEFCKYCNFILPPFLLSTAWNLLFSVSC